MEKSEENSEVAVEKRTPVRSGLHRDDLLRDCLRAAEQQCGRPLRCAEARRRDVGVLSGREQG